MPRNLEVKIGPVELAPIRDRAIAMQAVDHGVLHQVDTFFRCTHGRLKLRDFGTGVGELIAYERSNATTARASDYHIARTNDPAALAMALTIALGTTGRVSKRRHLLLWRNVRIHLDDVEGLGTFCELESVVGTDADEAAAAANLAESIARLGLADVPRIAVAYVDLMPG